MTLGMRNDLLKYELSPFPQLILKQTMYSGNQKKTELARAIEEYTSAQRDEASEQCDKTLTNDILKTDNYLLDGGSLVQRVTCTKGNICDAHS